MQSCRILFALLSVLIFQACSSPDERNATSLSIHDPRLEPEASPDSRGGASRIVPKRLDGGTALSDDGYLVPVIEGPPPDLGNQGEILHRIGPYDLLEIKVFNVEELSSEERVNEDGKIVLPLVGSIAVAGLTPEEAEQEIAEALGETYLQKPQVNVFISEYASLDVTVTGAVRRAGVYPITGRTTLLQALALAEGFDELADDDNVVIFRDQGTSSAKAYRVSVEQIQKGELSDPVLVGDDRIIVPKSRSMSVIEGIADTLRGLILLKPIGGYPQADD